MLVGFEDEFDGRDHLLHCLQVVRDVGTIGSINFGLEIGGILSPCVLDLLPLSGKMFLEAVDMELDKRGDVVGPVE